MRREDRREKLIAILHSNKDGVAMKELMRILEASLKTLEDDVKSLREDGFAVERKKGVLKLLRETDIGYTKRSDKTMALGLAIMEVIGSQEGELTERQIVSELWKPDEQYCDTPERKQEHDRLRQNVNYALKKLRENGWIIEVSEKTYRASMRTLSKTSVKDIDLLRFYEKLVLKGLGEPYFEITSRIADKIYDVMTDKVGLEVDLDQKTLPMSKSMMHKQNTENVLEKLFASKYKTHCLEVVYATRTDEVTVLSLGVGMIIFSCDHGKVYLLGKTEKRAIILDMEKITEIQDSNLINIHYNSAEFQQIYHEMFKVSVEEAYDTEIWFDHIFGIEEKVRSLVNNRKYASLVVQGGKIIYKDRVRGMNDLAKYLRGFGKSCQVQKPEVLADMMYESTKRVLARYGIYE